MFFIGLALVPCTALAELAAAQALSKSVGAPPAPPTPDLKALQERELARRRKLGDFGPVVVGDARTCLDRRRKVERPCGDYEDHHWLGEGDGQRWFNSGSSYGKDGKLLPAAEQYAEADDLYRKHCAGQSRTKSGLWTLAHFREGLRVQLRGWRFRGQDLEKFRDWANSRPESSGGLWAEAEYWDGYAWDARGERFAADVAEAAWPVFRERLTKAHAALELAAKRPIGCPLIEQMQIASMITNGEPKAEVRKVFDEAQKKFPEYHPIYFQMARAYLPQWGGSEQAVEAFANDAARLAAKFEGIGMYARIYANFDKYRILKLGKEELKPKWPKLKKGFEKLLALYPNGETVAFQFLDFACRVGDKKTYHSLRTRAVGHEESYRFREPLDACDSAFGWVESK